VYKSATGNETMTDTLWEILHLAWMMMTTYVVVRILGVIHPRTAVADGSVPSPPLSQEVRQ
jgi:hypothetical protein